jgi:hypothetical protein
VLGASVGSDGQDNANGGAVTPCSADTLKFVIRSMPALSRVGTSITQMRRRSPNTLKDS